MIAVLTFILLLALANALVINGIHKAFSYETFRSYNQTKYVCDADNVIDPDNSGVLGGIHYFFVRKFGIFWAKPLFGCVACMASFHSWYIFWPVMVYLFGFSWMMVPVYLLYIPITSALASSINSLS